MTLTKYGVDQAAVQALLDSGECQTEEEALEKVASGYKQTGAQTGRLSSKEPNLSNPPRSGWVPSEELSTANIHAEPLSQLGEKKEASNG